jgi:hypothetical protein
MTDATETVSFRLGADGRWKVSGYLIRPAPASGVEDGPIIPPQTIGALHADPANWKLGVFYYCKSDSRLVVPKRAPGFGWTINVAHRGAWILLGIITIAAYGVAYLFHHPATRGIPALGTMVFLLLLLAWVCDSLARMKQLRQSAFLPVILALLVLAGVWRLKNWLPPLRFTRRVEVPTTPAGDPRVIEARDSVESLSAEALATPPKLAFLAWQDENRVEDRLTWKPIAWHPDGSPVTDEAELNSLRTIVPGRVGDESNPKPRFLHLWLAHPAFDEASFANAAMLDLAGNRLSPYVGAATHLPSNPSENGWVAFTMSPGSFSDLPETLNVRLEYGIGPWTSQQDVPTDYRGGMTLCENVSLGSIGQSVSGESFISIVRGDLDAPKFQVNVLAVLHDGRLIRSSGGGTHGNAGAAT